jgi:dTDP-4-dehydrorhamnose reductase
MEKFRILILGAKGNLGQQLIKVFERDNKVIAWDRTELDITDKNFVIKKITEIKPGIIVNAAAYNAVDKCEGAEGYEMAERLNGLAPGYLAEAAAQVGAILIHYSSDYVFSGDKKGGYKEDDEPSPISKYGETKLMGERAIMGCDNLKYYIIRTSKLFGPKGESEVSKDSFFDLILRLAKTKDELDVVNEEISCFTYTPDLAKATKGLIENKNQFGVYHIVNSGHCTWHEAAEELFRIAGVKIKVNPVLSEKFARPAKRPKYSILLNTKLEPMRSYKDALKEYLLNLNQE